MLLMKSIARLLISAICVSHFSQGIPCGWNSLSFPHGYTYQAVGSRAGFTAVVSFSIVYRHNVRWVVNGRRAVRWQFDTRTRKYTTDIVNFSQGKYSAIYNGSATILTISFDNLAPSDNGTIVEAWKSDCNTIGTNRFTLQLKYCTTSSTGFNKTVNVMPAISSDQFRSGDKVSVGCISGYVGNVALTCLEDANWRPDGVCELEWCSGIKCGGYFEAGIGAASGATFIISALLAHVKYKLEVKKMLSLYIGGGVSIAAWAIGIGQAIVLSYNQAIAIIGLVLGALAIACEIVASTSIIKKISDSERSEAYEKPSSMEHK